MRRPDGHDILCPWPERGARIVPPPADQCDQCDLVHAVREDIAGRIEALPMNHTSPWRQIPTGATTFTRRDAYLRAARVARGESV